MRRLLPLLCIACSAGGVATGHTVREQCAEIFDVYCPRVVTACGGNAHTLADCEAGSVKACCQDSCDATSISSESSIHACADGIEATPCDALLAGELPASCVHVIKRPE